MQIKFISIGLSVAVLTAVANAADTVGVTGNTVIVKDVLTDIAGHLNVDNVLNRPDVRVASSKRGLSIPKTVATALRRRAMARRSEEADEEEEDENENEADEDEADEDEADEDEEDENENEPDEEEEDENENEVDENENEADENEYEENENEYEDNENESEESEEDTWERRSILSGGLPVVGELLGNKKSGKGGVLGAL
ncbi:unnamed protein product [Mucor hiemalis]